MRSEIFIFGILIGICFCDVSLNKGVGAPAPYAPSGSGPNGARLNYPAAQYGPPAQQRNHASELEVTQENVEFAQQVVEVQTNSPQPKNAYLPPGPPAAPGASQNAPNDGQSSRFSGQIKQLNTGEVFLVPSQQRFTNQNQRFGRLQSPQFAQRQISQQQRFTQQPFSQQQFLPLEVAQQQFAQQQFAQQQLAQQQIAQQQFAQQQFAQQQNVQLQTNSNQYAPPAGPSLPGPYPPAVAPTQQPENGSGSGEDEEEEDEVAEEEEEPVVAVSNSAKNGQYYILGKDNTLQRVVYQTARTEDDQINNGFTAQLRYSLVEPIRDPIYAYNSEGQLVRVYNKK